MAKKRTSNKEEKPVMTKKPTAKSIDWDSMPEMVVVVFNGKEVETRKENAKALVSAKRAKLK